MSLSCGETEKFLDGEGSLFGDSRRQTPNLYVPAAQVIQVLSSRYDSGKSLQSRLSRQLLWSVGSDSTESECQWLDIAEHVRLTSATRKSFHS